VPSWSKWPLKTMVSVLSEGSLPSIIACDVKGIGTAALGGRGLQVHVDSGDIEEAGASLRSMAAWTSAGFFAESGGEEGIRDKRGDREATGMMPGPPSARASVGMRGPLGILC